MILRADGAASPAIRARSERATATEVTRCRLPEWPMTYLRLAHDLPRYVLYLGFTIVGKPAVDDCEQTVNVMLCERVRGARVSEVRMVTLECLLDRLERVLGPDSLLYHRFAQGLRHEDESCLTDAMVSLRLYPDEIRRMVEDTVMSWLFGTRGEGVARPLEISPQG
jgi:hypothetical protein